MAKPGLTAEELRARPDWAPPKDGTKMQKRKWRMHFMEWNIVRLNEKEKEANAKCMDPAAYKSLRAEKEQSLNAAIEVLRRGDIPALRDLHRRRRGEYPRRKNSLSAAARWAVRCLRKEIWPEDFDGTKNRRREDGLTAEDIAAEWLLRGLGDEWLPGDAAEEMKADEEAKIKWKAPGKHKAPRRKFRAK